jgi:hypothetical protein
MSDRSEVLHTGKFDELCIPKSSTPTALLLILRIPYRFQVVWPTCYVNYVMVSRFHMVLSRPLVPSLSPRDIVWPNGVVVASSVVPLVPIVSGRMSLSISTLKHPTVCKYAQIPPWDLWDKAWISVRGRKGALGDKNKDWPGLTNCETLSQASHIYIYIYIHLYTFIYIYIHLYTFIYSFIQLYTFIYIYIHL